MPHQTTEVADVPTAQRDRMPRVPIGNLTLRPGCLVVPRMPILHGGPTVEGHQQIVSRDGSKVADVEVIHLGDGYLRVLVKSSGHEINVPYDQYVWRSHDWYTK